MESDGQSIHPHSSPHPAYTLVLWHFPVPWQPTGVHRVCGGAVLSDVIGAQLLELLPYGGPGLEKLMTHVRIRTAAQERRLLPVVRACIFSTRVETIPPTGIIPDTTSDPTRCATTCGTCSLNTSLHVCRCGPAYSPRPFSQLDRSPTLFSAHIPLPQPPVSLPRSVPQGYGSGARPRAGRVHDRRWHRHAGGM